MKKAYMEGKKCKTCHAVFVEESIEGNPYKLCPCCRHKAYQNLVVYAQKYIPKPQKTTKKEKKK